VNYLYEKYSNFIPPGVNCLSKDAGLDAMTLAKESETLLDRFPNATVNADE
jgi:hypothetical protein